MSIDCSNNSNNSNNNSSSDDTDNNINSLMISPDKFLKYTIKGISKIEIDNDKGIYTFTMKFKHIYVKYTFSIDENTFEYIDIMKLMKNDYEQIEFIEESQNAE